MHAKHLKSNERLAVEYQFSGHFQAARARRHIDAAERGMSRSDRLPEAIRDQKRSRNMYAAARSLLGIF